MAPIVRANFIWLRTATNYDLPPSEKGNSYPPVDKAKLWIFCHSSVVAHKDGDGWVDCKCGNRHWGLNGAAGLLLIRGKKVLLQHRAPWVHNGDTWGIPGGARDSHESITEAALREAHEEIGIETHLATPVDSFHDEHDGWAYDTVIAIAHEDLVAHEQNDESLQVEWVEFDQVTSKNLHPSFAKSWPELLARLRIKFI